MKKSNSIFRNFSFWFSLFVVLYLIGTIFILPFVVKNQIIDYLNNDLKQKATLERVTFNPLGFEMKFYNFQLFDKNNELLINFETARMDFGLLKTIFTQVIQFNAIGLYKPTINIKLLKDGSINFQKLMPQDDKMTQNAIKTESNTSSEDRIFPINFNTIDIEETEIFFTDYTANKPFKVEIYPSNYHFVNLSTQKDETGTYDFNIILNKHTTINGKGKVSLNPINVNGEINLSQLHVGDFWPKIEEEFNFEINDVLVDFHSNYNISFLKKLDLQFNDSMININNINLSSKNSKDKIISLENINTKIQSFNLLKQDIQIETVILNRLYTHFILQEDLSNNITPLFVPIEKNIKKKEEISKQKDVKNKEWSVRVKNIDLKDSKVDFNDTSIQKSFSTSVNNINLNVKNIDLKPQTKFDYTFKSNIGTESILQTSGKIAINPVMVETKYNLQKLPLQIFQPYLDETLNLELKKADFNTKGEFNLHSNHITATADTHIKDIDVKLHSSEESLLKMKQLDINKLVFDQNKKSLKIASVDLINPYAKIHIDKNKNTNFDAIIRESSAKVIDEKRASNTQEKSNTLIFDLGPIEIKEGSMNFTDLSLPLPFQSFIEKLNGRVSELSSTSSKPSSIVLDGIIDTYGLAKIDGALDYKNIKKNSKINMLFKNIATKNLSPYSSKFIGRKINGGKLTLDLHYKIVESKLNATNKIIIEKIALGEEIKSENSVNVPIDLAIALLEDSRGIIDLSLPISGNVDDPKFEIGSIVGQALTNLIVKIVTSPFSFLGSILGIEGKELKYIDFESGQAAILPPAQEKLDTLVKAFKTRPNLALEINKTYHKSNDSDALRKAKFDNKLKVIIDRLNKKHKDSDTYLMALEFLYNSHKPTIVLEDIKKTFWVGKDKDKDKDKVFQTSRYLNHLKEIQIKLETVETQELETIAKSRANSIVDYLVKKHQTPMEKIFIKETIILEDGDANNWVKTELGVAVKQK